MIRIHLAATAALALVLPGALMAEEFKPETLTVQKTIAPGANVFVLDQAWAGPSRINVLGADDLAMKGNLSYGTVGQMLLADGGRTIYTSSVYMPRYTHGVREAVIEEFDVETLSRKREIAISNRFAQVESQPALLRMTADGGYLLVQNATPATSVSVVDLKAGKQIAEIPTPGCWSIIPATEGLKFTSICGDGTFKSYAFAADGTFGAPEVSGKIFDAVEDALFTNGVRAGDNLVFASFKGSFYVISDAGKAPELVEVIPFSPGIAGSWAPSGSEVLTYDAKDGVLFVLMHSGAKEGTHKDPAEEIWAYDLKAKKLLYRSPAHGETSLTVSQSEPPVLFGVNEENVLHRYEVSPEFGFAAKPAGEAEDMGNFSALVLAGQ